MEIRGLFRLRILRGTPSSSPSRPFRVSPRAINRLTSKIAGEKKRSGKKKRKERGKLYNLATTFMQNNEARRGEWRIKKYLLPNGSRPLLTSCSYRQTVEVISRDAEKNNKKASGKMEDKGKGKERERGWRTKEKEWTSAMSSSSSLYFTTTRRLRYGQTRNSSFQ